MSTKKSSIMELAGLLSSKEGERLRKAVRETRTRMKKEMQDRIKRLQ